MLERGIVPLSARNPPTTRKGPPRRSSRGSPRLVDTPPAQVAAPLPPPRREPDPSPETVDPLPDPDDPGEAFETKPTTSEEIPHDRPLRERFTDAMPLLSVAIACVLIGLELRATASTGPVEAFPIWTLFLALGLVAGVGAGFCFNLDEEVLSETEVHMTQRKSSHGTTHSPPPADVRAKSPRSSATAEPDRPLPQPRARAAVLAWTGPAAAPAARRDPLLRPRDEGADPRDPSGSRVRPESMVAELDRLMADLRPSRSRSNRVSG